MKTIQEILKEEIKRLKRRGDYMDVDFRNQDIPEGYTVYPTGLYTVEIIDITKGQARTGTEQLKVKAKIVDGKYAGRHINDWISLTEKSVWRLVTFLWNLGVDTKKLGKLDTNGELFNRLLALLIGRQMTWDVIETPTQDGTKSRNEVTNSFRVSDQELLNMDDLEDVPSFLKTKKGKEKDKEEPSF